MLKRALHLTILLAGLALGGTAFAGFKGNFSISIDLVARRATGELSATRNSANNVEWLTCTVDTQSSTSLGDSMTCSGMNAAGTQFTCSSTSDRLIQAARSVHGDSYISVRWDANGACTMLTVRKSSTIAPKNP